MAQLATHSQELDELRNRLEWIDEERRKGARRLAELEQRLTLQEREITGRDQRIRELEQRLVSVTSQLARLPQFDTQLVQFKDEIVGLMEQYDQRRLSSEEEMERLRRVEHEVNVREIAEIRKELPAIGRLQNGMELREAEDVRLANLVGSLQNRFPPVESRIEGWVSDLAYLEELEKQNSRTISTMQSELLEVHKRWEPIYNRLDILADSVSRMESNMQAISDSQAEAQKTIKSWAEQVQLGEYERNQRLRNWQELIEDHQNNMNNYDRQWVKFSDQYKSAQMAVQTMTQWQEHIEQRQREASELARVEFHRMQNRWDNFVTEQEKTLTNYRVDVDQRWASVGRNERNIREQVTLLDERLGTLKQDLEMVWRVQTAQTDAMKQFPRIWQEEVEKTIAQNPNRRRQPALVPVREDFDL